MNYILHNLPLLNHQNPQIMKQCNIYKILFLFIVLVLFSSCNTSSDREYQVLTLENVPMAANYTNSGSEFVSTSFDEEPYISKLVASKGDLIYLSTVAEKDMPEYFFRRGDSTTLSIRVENDAIFMNNSLAGFSLSKDSSSWNQFLSLDPESVRQLDFIYLEDSLDDIHVSQIETFRDYFDEVGIVSEYQVYLDALLPILKPVWLQIYIDSEMTMSPQSVECLSDLELLNADRTTLQKGNLIPCCKNLKQLIINEWSKQDTIKLYLDNLKHLESLTLIDYPFDDLSYIEFPVSLTRLQLIGCSRLSDISKALSLNKLRSFSLAGCESVFDVIKIDTFSNLQYLSLPSNITQEEFNTILSGSEKLEVLEMIDCDSVKDLSILKSIESLRVLSLDQKIELAGLSDLDQLELLLLNPDVLSDSLEYEQLKNALPDTEIFPGGGFCVGSGWILLILPLLLVMRYWKVLSSRYRAREC